MGHRAARQFFASAETVGVVKAAPGDPVMCPHCGLDVMDSGFTLLSQVSKSYMRFRERGLIRIATEKAPPETVVCYKCGSPLPIEPVEMMRLV
jgi:hypothetical protein